MGAGRVLLNRVEELLQVAHQQDIRISQLNHEKECVIETARDWKARVRILARQRDEARQEWKDTANELAALRQSRAQERAQPAGTSLDAALEDNERLRGDLLEIRGKRAALAGQLEGTMDTIVEAREAAGEDAVWTKHDAFDLPATVHGLRLKVVGLEQDLEAKRAQPADGDGLPGFRNAVREALGLDVFGIDSAVVAIHKLKADLEMRDGDVDDLRRRVRELEDKHKAWLVAAEGRDDGSARPLWDVQKETILQLRAQLEEVRGGQEAKCPFAECVPAADHQALKDELDAAKRQLDRMEEQAASYRDTISGLRLTRPSSGDAPSRVEATLESREVLPRYEVRQVVAEEHRSELLGYKVWDRVEGKEHGRWPAGEGYTLDMAQGDAIAHMERMNRQEAERIVEATNRGGQ